MGKGGKTKIRTGNRQPRRKRIKMWKDRERERDTDRQTERKTDKHTQTVEKSVRHHREDGHEDTWT